MLIAGSGERTYLYVNGLATHEPIPLGPSVELLPAKWVTSRDVVEPLCASQLDFAVASVFLPRITSQLRISAPTSKDLAVLAWNSVWDAVLLSAFLDCEAVCNFQSNTSVEEFGPGSNLQITNYYLRGVGEAHTITASESEWILQNFETARSLLEFRQFREAVHALASYRWHSLPRARLALLWSGIEGLFDIDTEVVFRLSLYAARFLSPSDDKARADTFAHVKKLYKARSKAVHGGSVNDDAKDTIAQSAQMLRNLLQRCIETAAVPDTSRLAP